jgi:molybdopterin synthase sulfur carrier subunit
MPVVHFTAHLDGVAPQDPVTVEGATVAEALERIWPDYPKLKGYVLDDQDRVRKHVAIFINGELERGPGVLNLNVNPDTDIHVLQALSGG